MVWMLASKVLGGNGAAQVPFARTVLFGQVTFDLTEMVEVLLKAVNCMMVEEAI